MEHIFFEVQLCIKISIFKEISNIDILIILCLLTGLQSYCAYDAQIHAKFRSPPVHTVGAPFSAYAD